MYQPSRLPNVAEQAALIPARHLVQGLFLKVQPELWWSPELQRWIIVLPFDNGFPNGILRLPKLVMGVPLVPVAVPPAAFTGRGATLVDGVERAGIRRGADGLGTQLLLVSGRPIVRPNAVGGRSMVRPVGGSPVSLACSNVPLPIGNLQSMSPVVEVYDPLAAAPSCSCSCADLT